jgi:hypothetical protein
MLSEACDDAETTVGMRSEMQINGSENECLNSITARKDFASTRAMSAGERSKKLIGNFSHFHRSSNLLVQQIFLMIEANEEKILWKFYTVEGNQ